MIFNFKYLEDVNLLVKYKKLNEKIAMGLLSFMPREHDLQTLQNSMDRYTEDPNWQLYLWKQDEDLVGVIGIELDELTFTVHHAAVNPSFRNEGIGQQMIERVQQLHETLAMCSTHETKDFLEKCWTNQYPLKESLEK